MFMSSILKDPLGQQGLDAMVTKTFTGTVDIPCSLKPPWLGWWEAVTSQRGAPYARLTFDTGLNLPIPLPASVAEQRECRLLVAHDVPQSTNIQQLIPHFEAGMAVQDGVREGRRVPAWLVWKDKRSEIVETSQWSLNTVLTGGLK